MSQSLTQISGIVTFSFALLCAAQAVGEATATPTLSGHSQPQVVGDASPAVTKFLQLGPLQSDVGTIRDLIADLDARHLPKTFNDPVTGSEVMRAENEEEKRPHRLVQRSWHAIDADGSVLSETWELHRVGDREDVNSLSTVSITYTPWCEEVVGFEARVITPSGNILNLSSTQIVDRSIDTDAGDSVYTDDHERLAVLPGIALGAIVETCRRVRQKPWFPNAPSAGTMTLSDLHSWRIHYSVLTVDPSLDYSHRQRGPRLPLLPLSDDSAGSPLGIACMQCDSATLFDWLEIKCDPIEGSLPLCRYAINTTWEEQGLRYREQVEATIDKTDIETIVSPTGELPIGSTETKVRWALDQMARKLRYTGWSLGDRAVFPANLDEVWQRGYGDCKDQATFLVAMLRWLGVTAHVALVRSSVQDAEPELPNLSWFNHAIVAVRSDAETTPYYFIDPTLHCDGNSQTYPVYTISPKCCGHHALVCDTSPRLIKLTDSQGVTDTSEVAMLIYANETGHGCLTHYQRFEGWAATGIPDLTVVAEQERLRDDLSEKFKEQFSAGLEIGLYRHSHNRGSQPVVELLMTSNPCQVVDYENSRYRFTDTFASLMHNANALEFYCKLPDEDLPGSVPAETLPCNIRRNPVVIDTPKRNRYRFLVRIPAGLELVNPYEDETFSREHLSITTRHYPIDANTNHKDPFLKLATGAEPPWNTNLGFTSWKAKDEAVKMPSSQSSDQLFVFECDVLMAAGRFSANQWETHRHELSEAIEAGLLKVQFQADWPEATQLKNASGLQPLQHFIATSADLSRDSKRQQLVIISLIKAGLFETAERLLKSWEPTRAERPRDTVEEVGLVSEYLMIHLQRHYAEAIDYRELLRKYKCADHPPGNPLIDTLQMFADLQTDEFSLTTDRQKVHAAIGKLLTFHQDTALFDLLHPALSQNLIVCCLLGNREKLLLRSAESSPYLQAHPLIKFLRHEHPTQKTEETIGTYWLTWRIACMAGRQDIVDKLSKDADYQFPNVVTTGTLQPINAAEDTPETAVRELIDAIIHGDLNAMRTRLADHRDDGLVIKMNARGSESIAKLFSPHDKFCATEFLRQTAQQCIRVTIESPVEDLCIARISFLDVAQAIMVARDAQGRWRTGSMGRFSGLAKVWKERFIAGDLEIAAQWATILGLNKDAAIIEQGNLRGGRRPMPTPESLRFGKEAVLDAAIEELQFVRAPIRNRLQFILIGGNEATIDEILTALATIETRRRKSAHIGVAENLRQLGRYADAVRVMNQLLTANSDVDDIAVMLDCAHEAKLAGQLENCGDQWKSTMTTFYNQSRDPEVQWSINYLVQRINGKQNEMTFQAFERLVSKRLTTHHLLVARTALSDAVRFGYPTDRLRQSMTDIEAVYPTIASLEPYYIAACNADSLDEAAARIATSYNECNGYPQPSLCPRLQLSEAMLADRLGFASLASAWRQEIIQLANTSFPIQIAISIDRKDALTANKFNPPAVPTVRVAQQPTKQPARIIQSPSNRSVKVRTRTAR